MKRCLLTLFLLYAAAVMYGQGKEERFREKFPYRYEIRVGYGGSPSYDIGNFMRNDRGCCYDMPSGEDLLDELYEIQHGNGYVTGVFHADFSIHYRRWFTLAFNLGINGMWGKKFDPVSGESYTARGASFNLMPVARFYWVNTPGFRMYSAAGLGLYAGFYDGKHEITPAAMCNPIGFSAGKKLFFFGEIAFSTAAFGGNLGIGYRF